MSLLSPLVALCLAVSMAGNEVDSAVQALSAGRYEESARLLETAAAKAVAQKIPVLELVELYDTIADIHSEAKDQAKAEIYYTKAFNTAVLSPATFDTAAVAATQLSSFFLTQEGRVDDAEFYARQAATLFEQALGPDHVEVGCSLSNLAFILFQEGKYAEAVDAYKKGIAVLEKHFGNRHLEVGLSWAGLAESYEALGKNNDALKAYRVAQVILDRQAYRNSPTSRKIAAKIRALDKSSLQ